MLTTVVDTFKDVFPFLARRTQWRTVDQQCSYEFKENCFGEPLAAVNLWIRPVPYRESCYMSMWRKWKPPESAFGDAVPQWRARALKLRNPLAIVSELYPLNGWRPIAAKVEFTGRAARARAELEHGCGSVSISAVFDSMEAATAWIALVKNTGDIVEIVRSVPGVEP